MSDATTWLNNNSGGNGDGAPSVYFGAIGDKIIGLITSEPRPVPTKYGDRLVIEMKAAEGTNASKGDFGNDGPIQPGEDCIVWVRPGQMASAINDALKAAGAKGLTEGDTLAVKFVDEQDTGKPSKLKVYKAQYHVVKPAVSVDDLIPAEPPF
jgi:hypothetical protein